MLFAHAPKLVLTGSFEALRPVADRASALDADVVVICDAHGDPHADALGDVVGFDWAMVALDDATPTVAQLGDAVETLAGGLRRGALVVVASDRPVEQAAQQLAADLAHASGLSASAAFAVVACEAGTVTWGVDAQAIDEAQHLVSRIGAPVGLGVQVA